MTSPPPVSPAAETVLQIRGISKSFVGIPALVNVDLDVRSSEVHSIVGQNGAGKSTLMNILAGVLRQDSGDILLRGAAAPIADTAEALRLGIATVYQELSLLPNLSVAENVYLGREPRRGPFIDRRQMVTNTQAILERVGCGDIDPNGLVGRLALAQRQFVEIAKAVSFEPSVLVLDEPTASLASGEADRLFSIVDALKARGVAIIFISHRFAEVLRHADRVTILRNGRVIETREIAGVTEELLTELMIGGNARTFYAADRPPPPKASASLEAKGISLRGRIARADVSVQPGEIVALTGLLGAGQNELARIVGGDIAADAGQVFLNGATVAPGPRAAIAAGICLLTDDRKAEGLFPSLTVRENLTLPSLAALSRFGVIDRAAERGATAEGIAKLSIAAQPSSRMRTLSGGNQQKTIIARWMLRDLAALVLIEPTRGIDVGAKHDIYRDLEEMARLGKAILVVSSDVLEVLGIADRIVVFVTGSVHAEYRRGSVDEEALNLAIQGRASVENRDAAPK
jgi:ABC-type sugar transport system ATPase subunit